MSVWVNGGMIEVSTGDFIRVTPEQAAALPAEFAAAIAEAQAWATRWDVLEREYRPADDADHGGDA